MEPEKGSKLLKVEGKRMKGYASPVLPVLHESPERNLPSNSRLPSVNEVPNAKVKAYLEKEGQRSKNDMKLMKLGDVAKMSLDKEKALYTYYRNSAFYNIHMLLRYKSDLLSTSYRQPTKRVGYSDEFCDQFDRLQLPPIRRGSTMDRKAHKLGDRVQTGYHTQQRRRNSKQIR